MWLTLVWHILGPRINDLVALNISAVPNMALLLLLAIQRRELWKHTFRFSWAIIGFSAHVGPTVKFLLFYCSFHEIFASLEVGHLVLVLNQRDYGANRRLRGIVAGDQWFSVWFSSWHRWMVNIISRGRPLPDLVIGQSWEMAILAGRGPSLFDDLPSCVDWLICVLPEVVVLVEIIIWRRLRFCLHVLSFKGLDLNILLWDIFTLLALLLHCLFVHICHKLVLLWNTIGGRLSFARILVSSPDFGDVGVYVVIGYQDLLSTIELAHSLEVSVFLQVG